MLLTRSCKLRPTRTQHRLLEQARELQRQLSNAAVEKRIEAWCEAQLSITRDEQVKSPAQIRTGDPKGYRAQPVATGRLRALRHSG